MTLFGLTFVELGELWPFGLEFGKALKRLIDARSAKGFTPFQSVRDALVDATERMTAKAIDAPDAPPAAEQAQFDRVDRPGTG